ncbi:hypothetical protein OC845_004564 [Tilletia horrida]|nr:hypothetical protein OC845_004564 [Tilletia horrida]
MSDTQRLPMEIIFRIIDSVIDNPRAIYSPSDAVTKTLLSFTRVCRATHAHASNHLRRQCMFIDDPRRLADCVTYVAKTYPLVPEHGLADGTPIPSSLPGIRLCPITSLYLVSVLDGRGEHDFLHTAFLILSLFVLTRSNLKRLILDIPFKHYTVYAAVHASICMKTVKQTPLPSLIDAFALMPELEEFVSLRDPFPPAQDGSIIRVWAVWPKLRHLALHGPEIKPWFWFNISAAKRLETLILTDAGPAEGCLKSEYFSKTPCDTAETEPPTSLQVVFVAGPRSQLRDDTGKCCLPGRTEWPSIDPDNLFKVSLRDVPPFPSPSDDLPSHSDTREHMRAAALRGEIWDWQGDIVS